MSAADSAPASPPPGVRVGVAPEGAGRPAGKGKQRRAPRAACCGCGCCAASPMCALIRRRPCFYLGLTALVFVLVAGAGVGAVLAVSAAQQADDQARARTLVTSVATSFAGRLQGALFPSQTVVSYLTSGPQPTHAVAYDWFTSAAPALVATSSVIDDIQLAPYGHAAAIYPIVSPFRNVTGIVTRATSDSATGGGHDLFLNTSVIANRRSAAILALTARTMQIEGPKNLRYPNPNPTVCKGQCPGDMLGLLSRIAIFSKPNTTSNVDTWSQNFPWPAAAGQPLGPFSSVTNCATVTNPANGVSLCDTNAVGDGRRFWGFFTVIVVWVELLRAANVGSLGDATSGYKWSIARSNVRAHAPSARAAPSCPRRRFNAPAPFSLFPAPPHRRNSPTARANLRGTPRTAATGRCRRPTRAWPSPPSPSTSFRRRGSSPWRRAAARGCRRGRRARWRASSCSARSWRHSSSPWRWSAG
jgi:hypothetical protein